ncbi:MAG: mechanosensitive ion channel domain-containing protein [Pseudomonadota bacterium]
MEALINQPLEWFLARDGLPAWLVTSAPYVWFALKLIAVTLIAFMSGSVAKRTIRRIGRRGYDTDEAFEGSWWDLAASLSHLMVVALFLVPLLAVAGLDTSDFISRYGSAATGAAIILIAGIVIATWMSSAVRAFGERASRGRHGDATLFNFLATVLKYALVILTIILALQQFGFQSASLIAVVGAVGLAIALSLQDLLKGVAAGVMLAVFRPYRIGDWVEVANVNGEIVDISPFQTAMKDVENRTVVVPNDRAWSETIINYTKTPRRRLDLYFDISYDDDIDQALAVMKAALESVPRVLAKTDLWVGVHELATYSIVLRARPWTSTLEFLDGKSACNRAVKYAFDEAGITIPYPQQVEYQMPMKTRPASVKPLSQETGRADRPGPEDAQEN